MQFYNVSDGKITPMAFEVLNKLVYNDHNFTGKFHESSGGSRNKQTVE